MKIRSKFVLFFCFAIAISTAFAQQERFDSLVSVLPQLRGEEKLETLKTLIDLSSDLQFEKHYAQLLLAEARKQRNIVEESFALRRLTSVYYWQVDTDSVFIFGEEAIAFARQHKFYNDLFFVQNELIRRLQGQDRILSALRRAEAVYQEALELQNSMATAYMLLAIGHIHRTINQYEEAVRFYLKSIGDFY